MKLKKIHFDMVLYGYESTLIRRSAVTLHETGLGSWQPFIFIIWFSNPDNINFYSLLRYAKIRGDTEVSSPRYILSILICQKECKINLVSFLLVPHKLKISLPLILIKINKTLKLCLNKFGSVCHNLRSPVCTACLIAIWIWQMLLSVISIIITM